MTTPASHPFAAIVEQRAGHTALSTGGEQVSYAALGAEVGRARTVLHRWGLGSGGRLMVMGRNRVDWVVAKLACQLAGVDFVPISHRLTAAEVRHHVALVAPDWLLADEACTAVAGEGASPTPAYAMESLRDQGADDQGLVPCGGQPGRTLLFTGGTTGLPKAVVRRAGRDLARVHLMADAMGLGPDDHYHLFAPLYHSGPHLFLNMALFTGATAHVYERFDMTRIVGTVAAHPGGVLFGVPTHYSRLTAALEGLDPEHRSAPAIKAAVCAGAPLSEAVRQRTEAWLGPDKLWEFYGSTETGTVAILSPRQRREAPGSVGKPPANTEVLVLDAQGRALPPGEVGRLYVKNATLMEGYLNDDAATQAVRHGDFLTVSDLGCVDERGYVYLADRRSDLIISGGVNVYPAQVEAVLEALPEVAHVAVVGVADDDMGEVPVAVIEWRGTPLKKARLQEHLTRQLARGKHPRAFFTIGHMPLSPVGKVLRARAREMLSDLAEITDS